MFSSIIDEDDDGEMDFLGIKRKTRDYRHSKSEFEKEKKELSKQKAETEESIEKLRKEHEKLELEKRRIQAMKNEVKAREKQNRKRAMKQQREMRDKFRELREEKEELERKNKEMETFFRTQRREIARSKAATKMHERNLKKMKQELERKESQVEERVSGLQEMQRAEEEKKIQALFEKLEFEYSDKILLLNKEREELKKKRSEWTYDPPFLQVGMGGDEMIDYSRFTLNNSDYSRRYPPVDRREFAQMIRLPKFDLRKNFIQTIDRVGRPAKRLTFDALTYACFYGFVDDVEFLLSACDPSQHRQRAILEASTGTDSRELGTDQPYYRIVKMLMDDPRVEPHARKNYAMENACYNGHTDIVKLLMRDERVEVNDRALSNALFGGFSDIVEFLLFVYRKVEPTKYEGMFLVKCCGPEGVNSEVVSLLLKHPRVNPNPRNNAALLAVFERAYSETGREILEAIMTHPANSCTFDTAIAAGKQVSSQGAGQYVQFLMRLRQRICKEKRSEIKYKVNVGKLVKQFVKPPYNLKPAIIRYIYDVCGEDFDFAREMILEMDETQKEDLFKLSVKESLPEPDMEKIEELVEEALHKEEDSLGTKKVEKQKLRNFIIGFECPITQEPFVDPVIVPESGMTYERSAIEYWLMDNNTDPLTRQRLRNSLLVPNVALKNQMREWKEMQLVEEEEFS